MVQKRLNTYRSPLRKEPDGKAWNTARLGIRSGSLRLCRILLDGAKPIIPSLNERHDRTSGAVAANQEPGLIRCQSTHS